jgi:hypothetical protein
MAYIPFIRHGPHRKRRVQQFFYCVYICCRGNVFTEPLPSSSKGIHTQTDGKDLLSTPLRWDPDAVIYIPTSIKVGTGIQKMIRRHAGDRISLFSPRREDMGEWRYSSTILNLGTGCW